MHTGNIAFISHNNPKSPRIGQIALYYLRVCKQTPTGMADFLSISETTGISPNSESVHPGHLLKQCYVHFLNASLIEEYTIKLFFTYSAAVHS